jgi:large subunit ribosomal protein L24
MERKFNKQPKLHIRKGDTVKVISGDDKGKTGLVLQINAEKLKALVEGINMVTKHVKPSATKPEGGIQKKEAFIHISNLMVVNPTDGQASKVGRKLNASGKLQRYAKKTGEFINNG